MIIVELNFEVINQKIFNYCCKNGHLETIKYLFQIPNNNININAENDHSFYGM